MMIIKSEINPWAYFEASPTLIFNVIVRYPPEPELNWKTKKEVKSWISAHKNSKTSCLVNPEPTLSNFHIALTEHIGISGAINFRNSVCITFGGFACDTLLGKILHIL